MKHYCLLSLSSLLFLLHSSFPPPSNFPCPSLIPLSPLPIRLLLLQCPDQLDQATCLESRMVASDSE